MVINNLNKKTVLSLVKTHKQTYFILLVHIMTKGHSPEVKGQKKYIYKAYIHTCSSLVEEKKAMH